MCIAAGPQRASTRSEGVVRGERALFDALKRGEAEPLRCHDVTAPASPGEPHLELPTAATSKLAECCRATSRPVPRSPLSREQQTAATTIRRLIFIRLPLARRRTTTVRRTYKCV